MRNANKLRSLLWGTASVSAALTALHGAAYAQASDQTGGVNEIIVTAQKREQSIQDVPIAVTALDNTALEANRVESVADLTGLAPGLVARTTAGGGNSPSFALRGVNANASVPSQDRQISLYIDGV